MVRMHTLVPLHMEPLRHQGHVYCDGGMTNDFPMNALPDGAGHGRLGLMVRPKEWVIYNMGSAVEHHAQSGCLVIAPLAALCPSSPPLCLLRARLAAPCS